MTYCQRCKSRQAAVTTYWGADLCEPCCAAVAELLDTHDKWPPVPWNDTDKELIA